MDLGRYAWPGLTVIRDLISGFLVEHCVKMFGKPVHRRQSYFSTYMCLFNCQRKNKKLIYANVYRNTINDGRFTDVSPPDFPWGRGDVCTQVISVQHITLAVAFLRKKFVRVHFLSPWLLLPTLMSFKLRYINKTHTKSGVEKSLFQFSLCLLI